MVAVVKPEGRAGLAVGVAAESCSWGFLSNSLESVDVVSAEKAVEIDGVFSTGGGCAGILFPLPDHGSLQQAGALQGQL